MLEDLEGREEESNPSICELDDNLWEPKGFDYVRELRGLANEDVQLIREGEGYFSLSYLE